jgi:hypothetical protein
MPDVAHNTAGPSARDRILLREMALASARRSSGTTFPDASISSN